MVASSPLIRSLLIALLLLTTVMAASAQSPGIQCPDGCELDAGCPDEAPYLCKRHWLVGDKCVPKGFDYGRCGGFLGPHLGYCDECDAGCVRADGTGQTCEENPFAPYYCKEHGILYADHCVPQGYDHGCCGFAPGGGTCDICDRGCPLDNDTKYNDTSYSCREEAPYRCFSSGGYVIGSCVPYGYDDGCCGGLQCVENDPDNDCVPDEADNCPSRANPDQNDTDFDCIGDVCDPDMDNDGLSNEEEGDTDGDGKYDYAQDIDGDGEIEYGDYDEDGQIDPDTASSTSMFACDTDGDGIADGVDRAFEDISDTLAAIIGMMAVVILVYDAVKYIAADTAADAKARASAKSAFLYILLGLIVFLMAEPLVAYILATTSSTCETDHAKSCNTAERATIIYPENQEVYKYLRPVPFFGAPTFGKIPRSYEWKATWRCEEEIPGCSSQTSPTILGNTSYFINASLQPATYVLNLTVTYEDGSPETDTVIFGVSPNVD